MNRQFRGYISESSKGLCPKKPTKKDTPFKLPEFFSHPLYGGSIGTFGIFPPVTAFNGGCWVLLFKCSVVVWVDF